MKQLVLLHVKCGNVWDFLKENPRLADNLVRCGALALFGDV